MRQSVIILTIVLILSFIQAPSYSELKGSLEYTIPIDYENIKEADFLPKAEHYFKLAMADKSGNLSDNTTRALNLYRALQMKDPSNIDYAVKVGRLYSSIGKYRYAKGCFYQAMGIDDKRPEPYFYMGEMYFRREQYRQALKMYKKSYKRGFSNNSANIYRIEQLSKMLGIK